MTQIKRWKYPSTPKLPWTKKQDVDDIMLATDTHFKGKHVVVTEKMDGESFTGYSDGYTHARSLDSGNHVTRNLSKNLWASCYFNLPEGWRISAENVYAKHSIHYTSELPSVLLIFAVWDENNLSMDWETVKMVTKDLGLSTPPVLYEGNYDANLIHKAWEDLPYTSEGYVVRSAEAFSFANFATNVAKYVRPNHVQTNKHWTKQKVVPNNIKGIKWN